MKNKKGTALNDFQKQAQLGGGCARCVETFDVLNVDHIIPAALVEMLGLRWEAGYQDAENLELLCRRCNIIKGSRLNFNHPMTFPLSAGPSNYQPHSTPYDPRTNLPDQT